MRIQPLSRIATAALLTVALVGCGPAAETEQQLALVNGRPITLAQYQRSYQDYLFSGGLEDEPARRSAYLNRMIAVELIAAEARESGIERSPEFALARDRARQKLLIEAYLADEVHAGVQISDADVVDQFVRVNTKMTARHLFARTLEEARALKARLDAGATFEQLAEDVFEDPVLAASGGLVGTFGFDEMDPEFEDAAFRLRVGETSAPVKTAQGYSVIKLEERFTDPIMTESEFAEKRSQLVGYVRSRKQAKARRDFLAGLVASAQVRLEPDVAQSLVGQILGEAVLDEGASGSPFVSFSNDGQQVSWTLEQLRQAAEFTSDRQRDAVDDMHDLRAFVEGLAARTIMLSRAEQAGLARDERVRQGLDAALSEWIYEKAYNQLVAAMELPEADLRAYFDENKSEFERPRQARISEIVVATRSEADSIRAAVGRAQFADLARRHSLRPESAASGGTLGLISRADLGPWGEQVFEASVGDVLGPLATAGKFILIRIDGFEEARDATFDEARPEVEFQLRRLRQQNYLREHVQTLRARYPVNIIVESLDDLPLSGAAHV